MGYIPNIKINFTEDTDTFCQDTYKFQSLKASVDSSSAAQDGLVNVDLGREFYKEKFVNEFEVEADDLQDCRIENICTI